MIEQAEAEVVPSSSLVEIEVEVGIEVEVRVEVEVWVWVGGVMDGFRLTFSVGWVGGWECGE